MDRLGDMTWKAYYAADRRSRAKEVEGYLLEHWDDPDPGVEMVLRKGGLLSFPHTYISSSIGPLMRTVRAVHRSGKRKVHALGVVHNIDLDPYEAEFSLDGLEFISGSVSEHMGLPSLDIERDFFVCDRSLTDAELKVRDIERRGMSMKGSFTGDGVLLLTGDLAHYGHGYGTSVIPDYQDQLGWRIEEGLSLLYEKGDHLGFYLSAKRDLNDQAVVGILADTILGPGLVHRVFSSELTDYSEVLGTQRPTVVASVLYGAYRREGHQAG